VGGWRRLHSEEFCNLYTSPAIVSMGPIVDLNVVAERKNPFSAPTGNQTLAFQSAP
jgi:hypothetical protein